MIAWLVLGQLLVLNTLHDWTEPGSVKRPAHREDLLKMHFRCVLTTSWVSLKLICPHTVKTRSGRNKDGSIRALMWPMWKAYLLNWVWRETIFFFTLWAEKGGLYLSKIRIVGQARCNYKINMDIWTRVMALWWIHHILYTFLGKIWQTSKNYFICIFIYNMFVYAYIYA